MSLTVHQCGLACLRRIGVLSYDPTANATNQNRRGLCAGDLDEALNAINGAMEECFALGPIELSEQQQAGILRPATAASLDVTQYSTTIANLTTWASWMQGCTIRIGGDSRDNELISQTQLLRPFMGATAAGASASVYGDAIPLASSVLTVLGPVEIPEQMELCGVIGQEAFKRAIGMGFSRFANTANFAAQAKPIGQPTHWTVETRNLAANAFTQRILRVTPMPDKAYSLTYRAKVKPPAYAQSDFYSGTDYATDPGTIIPFDWAESTLLPVALQRFSAHPACENGPMSAELARQAEMAKRVFVESAKPMSAPARVNYRWRV
jgi:hypothetical protein